MKTLKPFGLGEMSLYNLVMSFLIKVLYFIAKLSFYIIAYLKIGKQFISFFNQI
tara:strand:+ start:22480 stop:22641 length:162 start_codon:yes stop_codon:yes gene_type:complete